MNKRFCILFLIITFSFQAFAQKKTALVLSGGGAKALAHIGVLKALEENQIQIDYIVGTSMGAFIGAMYATGMSPEEIEDYVISMDIESWVSNQKDPLQLYYFMEEDQDASFFDIKFKIDKKGIDYKLPTHLISANRLNFELMKLFSESCVAANYDFDQLMIPYRCVATDIDKSELLVLRNGSLCRSVRASMTFPFYLEPIRVNDKLLFDGGMTDNFPVATAIDEFNPDFIIGSKAAGNYDPPNEEDLMSIIQNMLTTDAEFSTLGKEGFILELDLPSIDIIDFSQTQSLIDSAYSQTCHYLHSNEVVKDLPQQADDLALKRSLFLSKQPRFIVSGVYSNLANKKVEAYTKAEMKRRRSIETYRDVEKDYLRLVANPSYKQVQASMQYDYESKTYRLVYYLKKNDPFQVDIGGNISSSNLTYGYLKLGYQYVQKYRFSTYINGYFGQFYSSVKGLIRFDIPSKIPLGIRMSGTYNHKNYFSGSTYFFEDEQPVFLKEDERFFQAELGSNVYSEGRLYAGLSMGTNVYNYYQSNNFSRSDTTDQTNYNYWSPFVSFEVNTLDKKQFANRGLHILLKLRYINGNEIHYPGSTSEGAKASTDYDYKGANNYLRLKLQYENYFLHLKSFHAGVYLEGVLSNQMFMNNYTSSILAADQFSPTIESQALFLPNYRAYNYGAAGLILSIDLLSRLELRTEGYFYQPYQKMKSDEYDKAYFEPILSSRFFIGSAGLVYDTRIGPVSVIGNYYHGSLEPWSLVFSFGYVIFNKMSFD